MDTESTIEYELLQKQLRVMEPSIDSVANGADDGTSQPRSATTSPDHEVQFRPQAASSAACGSQPMTGTDIDDYRTTSSTVPRATTDQ